MIRQASGDPMKPELGAPIRSSWVDAAKGIGIILVVYGHVARGLESAGIIPDSTGFRLVDSVIYSFHMPLFFFLSGIFLSSSLERKGFRGLVLGKAETLIYPYVVWSLLQGSLEAALSRYTNGGIGFDDVLSLVWKPRAQFWFLYVLFFTFVISGAAFSARTSVKIAYSLLAIALHMASSTMPDVWIFKPLMVNSVFFVAGSWFSRIKDFISSNSSRWITLSAIAAIGSQYLIHATFDQTYTDSGPLTLLAGVSCISTITAALMRLESGVPRWLTLIGASSMSIFLMHVLAGSGTRIVLSRFLGIESIGVHIVAGLTAGIALPVIAERLLRRFKLGFVLKYPTGSKPQRSNRGFP